MPLVQNADGDLTEANFGNDDDTMGRLEDMGLSYADQVGADVQRQQQVRKDTFMIMMT